MSQHLTAILEGRICCIKAANDLEMGVDPEKNTPLRCAEGLGGVWLVVDQKLTD
jgi:hypothetical protein